MGFIESILARLGYVRIPNLDQRLHNLYASLNMSTAQLKKAVLNNKPKPK